MKNRTTVIFPLLIAVLYFSSAVMAVDKDPDGQVSIDLSALESGVGGSMAWERGVLTFKGKNYPFRVKGITIENMETPDLSTQGQLYDLGVVYDLKDVQEFNGTYSAMQSEAAGKEFYSGVVWQNQNGVIMNLKPNEDGVLLTPAAEGVSVQIE